MARVQKYKKIANGFAHESAPFSRGVFILSDAPAYGFGVRASKYPFIAAAAADLSSEKRC